MLVLLGGLVKLVKPLFACKGKPRRVPGTACSMQGFERLARLQGLAAELLEL